MSVGEIDPLIISKRLFFQIHQRIKIRLKTTFLDVLNSDKIFCIIFDIINLKNEK